MHTHSIDSIPELLGMQLNGYDERDLHMLPKHSPIGTWELDPQILWADSSSGLSLSPEFSYDSIADQH